MSRKVTLQIVLKNKKMTDRSPIQADGPSHINKFLNSGYVKPLLCNLCVL